MKDLEQKNFRDFLRMATIGTALGFGAVAGSLYSLKPAPSGFAFDFSIGTIVAFAFGALAGWIYWRKLGKLIVARQTGDTAKANRKNTGKIIAFSLPLCAGGLMAFLYPLRFVRGEQMREAIEGLGAAFLVVGVLGVALWHLIKFFNQDVRRDEGDEPP